MSFNRIQVRPCLRTFAAKLRTRWLMLLIVAGVVSSVATIVFTDFTDTPVQRVRELWELLPPIKMAADLTSSLLEVGHLLRQVDWLFWVLLFVPFNFYYVTNKEQLLKLQKDVDFYKEDNAVKRKFIKWQGKVNLELQEAVAELRLERRALKTLMESLRKQMERKQEDHESYVKKNKSDSAIADMVEAKEEEPEVKPRPKTEEGKSTSSSCGQYQNSGVRKRREQLKSTSDPLCSGDPRPSLSSDSSSEDNSVGKLKPPNRSKYTLRKELEQYTLPTSRLKSRPKEKKNQEPSQNSMKVERQKSSHLPLSLQGSFSATEELVATLDLHSMGRAASYTEVYKKKVHMPSCGKPPEITIEGKQRWCF